MTNILVIDINATTVYRIKKLLEHSAVEVYGASTFMEAINKVNSMQDELDIVIVDINLGSEDGFELITKIKDTIPNIVTIIMTSINTRKSFIKAIRAGVIDYILKPYEDEYLKLKLITHLKLIEQSKSIPHATHHSADASLYVSIKKAVRENYELLIGLILVYNKKNPTQSSSNVRDISLLKMFQTELQSDLAQEDEVIPFGNNGFLLVLNRKSLQTKPIVHDYYRAFCKHFFEERSIEDFAYEIEFVNLPHEIDPKQSAIEVLTHKIEKRL